MDLRQIEYFRLAARAGSFSAAAKSAYVTQQTLSASIASLEQEWGMPLFNRRRQGVELTAFGETMLPACEHLLEEAAAVGGLVERYRDSVSQTVTFAYATASLQQTGEGLTLQGLAQFRADRSEVDLRVFELTSDACLSAVAQGEVDMAFVVGRPDPAQFSFTKLADAHLLVALPADHPLAAKEAIGFRDLAGVPIFPTPDLKETYHRIVAGFERYGLKPNYVPLPFSLENAQRFVRDGEGVDFSPEHNAAEPPEGIVYRPLAEEDAFTLPLGLVEKLGKPQNPVMVELKELIQAQ